MKQIHVVSKNSDETEGRGRMVAIAHFSERPDAVAYTQAQPDAYKRSREWKGNRYGDLQLDPITVFESLDEVEGYVPVDLKAQALAKLTAEEKRALGF